MGRSSSQVLLDLETQKNSSFKESTLLVCKSKSETTKTIANPPDRKPTISSLPKSQVLGKVKDFLGVMEEANKRLHLEATDKPMDYNIEALTGNESEYIEMDLMLGVADLHTPEAVAAAESAIVGCQPVISLDASSSGADSDDSSDDDDSDDTDEEDDDENDKDSCTPTKLKSKHLNDESAYEMRKKRSKIVELS